MSETTFIATLRALAAHPGARGLMDDAAVLDIGGAAIVLTHDTIVEGVHFLPDDPPEDVAWKLVAVNLSDLAAKGAKPLGVLAGYCLTGDDGWDAAFVRGLRDVLGHYETPLLGGDTVSLPQGAPRVLGLTAIGRADGGAPSRTDARAGDALWVTGTIGDAGYGLALLQTGETTPKAPISAYRRPRPLLLEGSALAPHVHAMMDVSDGLLIDAARMAEASGLALEIDLDAAPLSPDVLAQPLDGRALRLSAATAGDDYQLLFAAAPDMTLPVAATRVGTFAEGAGLTLFDRDGPVPLPEKLGYLHG
ncbi:thiamine-phosphate kinase [Sphingomonas cavernae]|uniref:Thiamine-monophosphate kinase n=1 Tax=Sphingomonas cavernae TaxID=2320861 RepID=A0A418WQA5_9SPHN|nr:thiamine-phosphate kinase [Sphingomonas cavernae]RJF93391.1 thiamine-phosphate kinase [Sphingomonas cavernae]